MNELLHSMIKGLVLHYLHGGTVEEAIRQGRDGGVPGELLESLPGMMFHVTSAAGAISGCGRPFNEVVHELTRNALGSGRTEDFGREDAEALVRMTLEFFQELSGDEGEDAPLPHMAQPWHLYGAKEQPPSGSSGRRVRRS